jgi:arylsulfatase A-like enzyme
MVVHWPKRIRDKGGIRTQFGHVIDVAPTILEAAGLPEPKVVNGTPQRPIEGTSLVYTFDDAAAKERHTTQYFEIAGNRAIYHEGWLARTIHKRAVGTEAPSSFRRRRLGALPREGRFQPREQSRGGATRRSSKN